MKKIFIIIGLILAAGAGFYFGYWTKTPAYAAGEIQQSIQKKDLQLFKERVDMEKVYSYAVDDVLAELKTLDDAKIEDAFYRDLAFGRTESGQGSEIQNCRRCHQRAEKRTDFRIDTTDRNEI